MHLCTMTSFALKALTLLLVTSPSDAQYYSYQDAARYSGNPITIPCSGDVVEFETSVLVDFDGFDDDPRDTTRINWKGLELTFKDTYDRLSHQLCDDEIRQILFARIEKTDGSYLIKRGGNIFSLRYTVRVRCKGCDPDTVNLFAPPVSHSLRELGVNPNTANLFPPASTYLDLIRDLKGKGGKGYKSGKKTKKTVKGKGQEAKRPKVARRAPRRMARRAPREASISANAIRETLNFAPRLKRNFVTITTVPSGTSGK